MILQYSPETKFFTALHNCLNFRYRLQSLPQHLHPGIMKFSQEGEGEGEGEGEEGSLSSMSSSSSTQQGLQEEEEGEVEDAESTDKVRAIDGTFVVFKGAQS